jgi:hypothetical protein
MKTPKAMRGWCANCGGLAHAAPQAAKASDQTCQVCGEPLKPLSELAEEEKAMADMQAWFVKVCRTGVNGPSPTMAAEELGCSRSMIDRLVERGILEKSEFCFKDRTVVIISRRSLAKAKENRLRTGNWTGHPVKRGA